MGIKEWLIPQDKVFFSLLIAQSSLILKGAKTLTGVFVSYNPKKAAVQRKVLKKIEEQADSIIHQVYERLCSTFITPIDHEDIAKLVSAYDDVMDRIYRVVNVLYLYDVRKSTLAMTKFAKIILAQVKAVDKAINLLRKLDRKEIEKSCVEIHRLENMADRLLNQTMGSLFVLTDAKEIIKLKEVYDLLETATDKCEKVSNLIRNIVMKNL